VLTHGVGLINYMSFEIFFRQVVRYAKKDQKIVAK